MRCIETSLSILWQEKEAISLEKTASNSREVSIHHLSQRDGLPDEGDRDAQCVPRQAEKMLRLQASGQENKKQKL